MASYGERAESGMRFGDEDMRTWEGYLGEADPDDALPKPPVGSEMGGLSGK